MNKKKIGLVSLGCPKNLVDSEEMVGRLTQAGYEFTNQQDEADLILINTCGFIEAAKEESIETILAYTEERIKGNLKGLVVTGCLAQRYPDTLTSEMPEVDRFLPLQEESKIVEVVDRLLEPGTCRHRDKEKGPFRRIPLTPSYTAYLKISDGCSNHCTYCTIPLIRGPHQSREIPDLLAEADALSRRGVRELILIGQDIARFGYDNNLDEGLIELSRSLVRIQGLSWIRLMYVHPDHLTNRLIELMASEPRIVPYLDFPIQHIHDPILKMMNRQGTSITIREQIRKLRNEIPGLSLRTTLIVGFPGETQEAFQKLYDFVEEARFEHLGVFTYSREENTPAADYPNQIDDAVKEERREKILKLQAGIAREKNLSRIGRTESVLVEGRSQETDLLLAGRYYGQAPEIDGQVLINKGNADAGEFYDVRITGAHTYDLVGEIVSP